MQRRRVRRRQAASAPTPAAVSWKAPLMSRERRLPLDPGWNSGQRAQPLSRWHRARAAYRPLGRQGLQGWGVAARQPAGLTCGDQGQVLVPEAMPLPAPRVVNAGDEGEGGQVGRGTEGRELRLQPRGGVSPGAAGPSHARESVSIARKEGSDLQAVRDDDV